MPIKSILTDTSIKVIRNEAALPDWVTRDRLARFLHEVMKPYQDKLEDIKSALSIVFDDGDTPGGFVILATQGEELLGVSVIHHTPWSGYVPENMLLYIGVRPECRSQGIGRALIDDTLANCEGSVKLHVEYDNPAMRLYERVGFTSKYAEMRYIA